MFTTHFAHTLNHIHRKKSTTKLSSTLQQYPHTKPEKFKTQIPSGALSKMHTPLIHYTVSNEWRVTPPKVGRTQPLFIKKKPAYRKATHIFKKSVAAAHEGLTLHRVRNVCAGQSEGSRQLKCPRLARPPQTNFPRCLPAANFQSDLCENNLQSTTFDLRPIRVGSVHVSVVEKRLFRERAENSPQSVVLCAPNGRSHSSVTIRIFTWKWY